MSQLSAMGKNRMGIKGASGEIFFFALCMDLREVNKIDI